MILSYTLEAKRKYKNSIYSADTNTCYSVTLNGEVFLIKFEKRGRYRGYLGK